MNPQQCFMKPLEQLPDPLAIPVWSRSAGQAPLDCTIRPPGSKSLTNRALLLAALGSGTSEIRHPLIDADDAERMIAAVEALGARTERDGSTIRITGVGGRWKPSQGSCTLDLHHSGTATRFLAASALLSPRPITITGSARIQQRPIDELVDLLVELGCSVEYHGVHGCPPVTITPPTELPSAPVIRIGKTRSSQYISALLIVGTCLPSGLSIQLTEEITSASYIQMTIDQLDTIGIRVQASEDLRVIRVHPGLGAFSMDIEPDASTASYWWGAGALLNGGSVRVDGVGVPGVEALRLRESTQGDARFPLLLEQMGCTLLTTESGTVACRAPRELGGILVDMSSLPDTVMTLASVAAFAKGTTIVRGVRTLRDKECDRIEALVNELGRVGVAVEANLGGDPDALSITAPAGGVDCSDDVADVVFETYDDHRMAMALSLIGLRRPNCWIADPACVAKSDARYWRSFAGLYS